jgi:hypothetical protein
MVPESNGRRPAVREVSDDPAHPSVRDVQQLAICRATNPRSDGRVDSRIDDYAAALVTEHGERAVTECIRLVLTDDVDPPTAGVRTLGDEREGVYAATVARHYLDELHATGDYERRSHGESATRAG